MKMKGSDDKNTLTLKKHNNCSPLDKAQMRTKDFCPQAVYITNCHPETLAHVQTAALDSVMPGVTLAVSLAVECLITLSITLSTTSSVLGFPHQVSVRDT